MWRSRFNVHFIDSLLVFAWCTLGVVLVIGFVWITLPPWVAAPVRAWLGESDAAPLAFTFAFLSLSVARLLINCDASPWALLVSYALTCVLYRGLWPNPVNVWVAPLVPACVLALLWVPASYVWARVEPVPMRRVPIARGGGVEKMGLGPVMR
jgi:hypothetical protein